MKPILIHKHGYALVDNEDYELLSKFEWNMDAYGYAVSAVTDSDGSRKFIRMHRMIMNAPTGLEVDHINGERMDNQKSNLRLCTKSENGRNRPANRNNTSGFKGVIRAKTKSPGWTAQIKVNKVHINLGNYDTPEAAHEAYKVACIKYHGSFANVG